MHEGVKYHCEQCNHQFTTKGSLAEHKRSVHEGVKYPCEQCGLVVSLWGYLYWPCGQQVDGLDGYTKVQVLLLTVLTKLDVKFMWREGFTCNLLTALK